MRTEFFIPEDNELMRSLFEVNKKGTCGPSCIAVLCKCKVAEIIFNWKKYTDKKGFVDNTNYRGFAPVKELMSEIESRGFKIKKQRGLKARKFPHPKTGLAIVRVVFLKEDGTEFYWMAQPSHYILIKKISGKWWVFSNDMCWVEEKNAEDLLVNGYVSSYIEIQKVNK